MPCSFLGAHKFIIWLPFPGFSWVLMSSWFVYSFLDLLVPPFWRLESYHHLHIPLVVSPCFRNSEIFNSLVLKSQLPATSNVSQLVKGTWTHSKQLGFFLPIPYLFWAVLLFFQCCFWHIGLFFSFCIKRDAKKELSSCNSFLLPINFFPFLLLVNQPFPCLAFFSLHIVRNIFQAISSAIAYIFI